MANLLQPLFLNAVTSKSAMASLLGLFPVLGIASPIATIIGAVSSAVSTTALSWLKPWNKKMVRRNKSNITIMIFFRA